MQVDRSRMLKRVVLAVRCRYHIGMTMPYADRDDPAKRVEIASASFVPDVLHLPFHDHDRLLVVEKNSGIQEFTPQAQDFVNGWTAVFGWLMIGRRKLRHVHRFLNPTRRNAM